MLTSLSGWLADPKNWGALLITAPIAIVALIVAVKNYQRKSGIAIRGSFGVASSSRCDDDYVSYIVLENLKDRAFTIYCIYLKIGHNFYMELDGHNKAPLILKPYETYHKDLGEIVFYTVNTNTIGINKLLNDKRVKKRLVLSTSEGKYTVPKEMKRWSPLGEFFSNHLTGIIRIVRVTHNNESIGGNVRFIVEIINKDGHAETIKLLKSDYQLVIFKNFSLTENCLLSKENLESFLREKVAQGLLPNDSIINVYDFAKHKNEVRNRFAKGQIEAERWGAFYYYVFGRIYTWYSNFKIMRVNKRAQKKHRIKLDS